MTYAERPRLLYPVRGLNADIRNTPEKEGYRMERVYQNREKRQGRPQSRRGTGKTGARVALAPRECRRLLQLGVCIALFLVVFIGKGVFPQQMLSVRDRVSQIISGNTDFKAVFANLGHSISEGEPVGNSLGNLWVEVFGNTGITKEKWSKTKLFEETRAALHQPLTVETILNCRFGGETQEKSKTQGATSTPLPAETAVPAETPTPEASASPQVSAEPAVVHVDYSGPALPANATMDRYNLGLAETISPIAGASGWWVSSGFGWREHPVDGEEKFHNGVDLAVNDGTSVKAFADGVVDYIGESPIYGLYTQLRHSNGVTSFYAHCGSLLVQKGQSVKMGDMIAQSGETGNATGPHLHFEIKKDGVLLNPLYYIDAQ